MVITKQINDLQISFNGISIELVFVNRHGKQSNPQKSIYRKLSILLTG